MKYGGWILSDLTPCNLTQNEWLLSLFWEVKILSEENLDWPSFPSGSAVKNPPAMQETQEMWVQPPGGEDPLEEGTATHSSVLAWRIPRTEEPGGLQSTGLPRVRHGGAAEHTPRSWPHTRSPAGQLGCCHHRPPLQAHGGGEVQEEGPGR